MEKISRLLILKCFKGNERPVDPSLPPVPTPPGLTLNGVPPQPPWKPVKWSAPDGQWSARCSRRQMEPWSVYREPQLSPPNRKGRLGPRRLIKSNIQCFGQNVPDRNAERLQIGSSESWGSAQQIRQAWDRETNFEEMIPLVRGEAEKARGDLFELIPALGQSDVYPLWT